MAGNGGKLSTAQERALLSLLGSRTVEDAARGANVSNRSLWRWMRDPFFVDAYRKARATSVEHAISRLQQASGGAVEILTAIMNDADAPAAARVTAAVKILEMAIRGTEIAELQRRVEELEKGHELSLEEDEEDPIVTTH